MSTIDDPGQRGAELEKQLMANQEPALQGNQKETLLAARLIAANEDPAIQQSETNDLEEKLVKANTELAFQLREKEARATELVAAEKELAFQQGEKGKRAAELITADKKLVSENAEKEKRAIELNKLVFYDVLTGLPNRRLIIDRIHHAIAHSARNGREGVVMFIGLDRFKDINDTQGHEFGDRLLREVAQRIVSCLRVGDTAGRLGGDQFVVVLVDASSRPMEAAMAAHAVGAKVLTVLAEPYLLSGHECFITASIGATFFSEYGKSPEELLKCADLAMYEAKKDGRSNLRFFSPDMQTLITERVELERDLRAALDLGQFVLYYQIQVNNSHSILGVETLIRWSHPQRGLVSPADFIPIAEDTGLIVPIGLWVLETACSQLAAWQFDKMTSGLVISVNISAGQFHQANFVTQVLSIVERHAINPALLKLELTESLLLENVDECIESIRVLKAVGIQFSLDDFGTGYSSLRYLKKLPLDEIKIDRSFVGNIVSDSDDRAIVLAIITMAHSLGLDVIAEGVETVEQQQSLLEAGCLNYQGYLFGRPVPIEELTSVLLHF